MIFSFKIRKGFGRAYFQGGLSEIYGIHTNRNMKRLVYCRYGQYRIIRVEYFPYRQYTNFSYFDLYLYSAYAAHGILTYMGIKAKICVIC